MTKQENRKPATANAPVQPLAGLDRDIQLRIGDNLRAMYDDIVKQGVPDRFANLLAQLDDRRADEKESDDT